MISKILKKILIKDDQSIKIALKKLKNSGHKCLLVINKENELVGTCSDGDIRKKILTGYKLNNKISHVYNKKPIFLDKKLYTAYNVKKKFKKGIDVLPILNDKKHPIEVILKSNLKIKLKKKIKSKKNLNVIIMAGGLGARLKPFTNILPKALIPINGKPIIDLIIENLKNHRFNKIYISISKKDKILKSYFLRNKNIKFLKKTHF